LTSRATTAPVVTSRTIEFMPLKGLAGVWWCAEQRLIVYTRLNNRTLTAISGGPYHRVGHAWSVRMPNEFVSVARQ